MNEERYSFDESLYERMDREMIVKKLIQETGDLDRMSLNNNTDLYLDSFIMKVFEDEEPSIRMSLKKK